MSSAGDNRFAPHSIGRLLADGAERLVAAGLERRYAGVETRRLLEHASGVRLEELIAYPEKLVRQQAVVEYRAAIDRRAAREPCAYIVGKERSRGLDFSVNRDVLIPRWETALLIELATEHLKRHPVERPRICDLGTGSGIVAVHVALDHPHAEIVATDISAEALEVARANAQKHDVADRIRFVRHDMTSPTITAELGQFDVVLSNPPYIPTARLESSDLEPEVTEWEPRIALDGGIDGLAVLRPLIAILPTLLKPLPTSAAFLETDDTTAETCADLARSPGLFARVEVHNDEAHRHRAIAVYRSAPPATIAAVESLDNRR